MDVFPRGKGGFPAPGWSWLVVVCYSLEVFHSEFTPENSPSLIRGEFDYHGYDGYHGYQGLESSWLSWLTFGHVNFLRVLQHFLMFEEDVPISDGHICQIVCFFHRFHPRHKNNGERNPIIQNGWNYSPETINLPPPQKKYKFDFLFFFVCLFSNFPKTPQRCFCVKNASFLHLCSCPVLSAARWKKHWIQLSQGASQALSKLTPKPAPLAVSGKKMAAANLQIHQSSVLSGSGFVGPLESSRWPNKVAVFFIGWSNVKDSRSYQGKFWTSLGVSGKSLHLEVGLLLGINRHILR